MKDFLFLKNQDTSDWFYKKYNQHLGLDAYGRGRWPTMKIALNLYLQRNGGLILETGCQREPDDWGAGASTSIFLELLKKYQCGNLISVDNNKEHLDRSKRFVNEDPLVTFYESDSVQFLKGFNQPISLLYLDSYDYPYGDLLDLYGGKTDINAAIIKLNELTEKEILFKHNDLLIASQQHCAKELEAAFHSLHEKSIILIDDNSLAGGGKPRLAREILLDHGWQVVLDYQQTLWIKS